MSLRLRLKRQVAAYCKINDISHYTLSGRAGPNKRMLKRLMVDDGDVSTGVYEKMQQFFRNKAADPDALEQIGKDLEQNHVA